jgi:hypothetical protein
VGEFSEVKTDEADDKCSLVAGTITIYAEDEEAAEKPKSKWWAIFKRTEGDPFLFRELFETVASHK